MARLWCATSTARRRPRFAGSSASKAGCDSRPAVGGPGAHSSRRRARRQSERCAFRRQRARRSSKGSWPADGAPGTTELVGDVAGVAGQPERVALWDVQGAACARQRRAACSRTVSRMSPGLAAARPSAAKISRLAADCSRASRNSWCWRNEALVMRVVRDECRSDGHRFLPPDRLSLSLFCRAEQRNGRHSCVN